MADVEYHVEAHDGKTFIFENIRDASEKAFYLLLANGEAVLDVIIYSEKGAEGFGGTDALERYQEDPEASVYERWEFKANCLGRIS